MGFRSLRASATGCRRALERERECQHPPQTRRADAAAAMAVTAIVTGVTVAAASAATAAAAVHGRTSAFASAVGAAADRSAVVDLEGPPSGVPSSRRSKPDTIWAF